MKRALLFVLIAVVTVSVAMAQIPTVSNQTTDILGAHTGYGRGCVMCHAPHSGSAGNGVSKGDATSGNYALWGQDLTPLYGQTLGFGDGGAYPVTLPAAGTITSAHDANTIILFCLSCHDGNLAKVGMMKGKTVETLPVVGGNAPTFLGNDGSAPGNYNNDHPVGASAIVSCGGTYNWDCTGGNTTAISMNGPASSVFANTNYGFAVSFGTFGSAVTAVTCTSCHNQHSQNVYSGKMGGVKGNYATMFFLRGYYNPTTGGNSAAQFCRQCHGGESNEMAGQLSVPTT
jgi:cytochrome c553